VSQILTDLQSIRERYIKAIETADNKTQATKSLAESLFNTGLTVYSRNFTFKSAVYNAFSTCTLDNSISLHPEQFKILDLITKNKGFIFSAPTSFGKTFIIFEYIARNRPNNIVLVVPTLALVDEYKKRIIRKYKEIFNQYKVHTSITEDSTFNFEEMNIFILTHDRVVEKTSYLAIKKIDLLVIDEVYKLKKNELDDRVLVLNIAYYHLVKIANKHVLLAPFIGGVEKIDELEHKPLFYKTDFSPVVNEIKIYEIESENERLEATIEVLNSIPKEHKTMLYFPTVTNIGKFIQNLGIESSLDYSDSTLDEMIKWMKEEIHEEWYLVKALELGFLVHHAQMPSGIQLYQLYLYEESDQYNRILCTSTLLEGVNISAKNIIITKPARYGYGGHINFDAFDFFNLVGRSGRLIKHNLGIAHYIKMPSDPEYIKEEAVKNIEFELTDDSVDIDIYTGNYQDNPEYIAFLLELNMTHEDYIENFGNKYRFKSIQRLYRNYLHGKSDLIKELNLLKDESTRGRLFLVQILCGLIEGKLNKLHAGIVNQLLHKRRLNVHKIIDNIRPYFSTMDINYLISTVLRLKSSYIEHGFYSKLNVILFFLNKDKTDEDLLDIIEQKIKQSINLLYFTDSIHKKMLKDLGIYERDIDKIIAVIGEDFQDTFELKNLLLANKDKINKISFVSRFVIKSLSN